MNNKYDNVNKDNEIKSFNFIHFNDVYNISPNNVEPIGGAARFVHLVKSLKQEHPGTLLFFSGDIFAPSVSKIIFYKYLVSTLYKGEQMVTIIDELEIDVACVGNHDYDFGIERLKELIEKTKIKFPWLISNLYDKINKPLFPGTQFYILEKENIKIGFMGLVEYDWVQAQYSINPNELIYEDFLMTAKKLISYFKDNQCDFIIALTHMRNYNDIILSENIPEIDLILGGHDHDFFYKAGKGNIIIKSGTDFREMTFNQVKLYKNFNQTNMDINYASVTQNISENKMITNITKNENLLVIETDYLQITSDIKEDETIKKIVNFLQSEIEEKSNIFLVNLANSVDARFSKVRNFSLPISNFLADLVNIFLDTEVTIINSGSLRMDSFINQGEFNYGNLRRLIPNEYPLVRLKATGLQIWKILENGVSKFPALEGRFPMISGITFTFNPNLKPLTRINPEEISINDKKLDLNKTYSLSCREYIFKGFDGYAELTNCINIDKCEMENMLNIIMKFFEIVRNLKIDQCGNLNFSYESGVFGFDQSNNKLIDYLNKNVNIINNSSHLKIESELRIKMV